MPLASLQKKLLVFQGIQNNDASVVFGSHGLGRLGDVDRGIRDQARRQVGISVDQAFAQSLPANTTRIPNGIQLGITNRMYSDIGNPAIYNGCISWANATQPMQPQIQPGVVFDQIFMGASPTASAADGVRRRAIASSVLDHVMTRRSPCRVVSAPPTAANWTTT